MRRRRGAIVRYTVGLVFAVAAGTIAAHPVPPRTIVAFGDSYFSGYGVEPGESFPAQLERALRGRGHNARVLNAGVDGETIADGLARLDRVLAQKPALIILELGSNDAEQGLDPEISRTGLDEMITRIKAAHVPLLLCGAAAPPDFGLDYETRFNPIFQDLAEKHHVPLYRFILDGVASDAALVQDDGEHPNPKGVAVMVKHMLPSVEQNFSIFLR